MKKLIVAVCALTVFAFGVTSVMAKDAADIFKSTCASCHGAKGEGKKALAPALKGSAFVTKGTDADVKATVTDGRAGAAKKFKEFPSAMPAQKGSLSGAEIDSVVKYIKTDLQK